MLTKGFYNFPLHYPWILSGRSSSTPVQSLTSPHVPSHPFPYYDDLMKSFLIIHHYPPSKAFSLPLYKSTTHYRNNFNYLDTCLPIKAITINPPLTPTSHFQFTPLYLFAFFDSSSGVEKPRFSGDFSAVRVISLIVRDGLADDAGFFSRNFPDVSAFVNALWRCWEVNILRG